MNQASQFIRSRLSGTPTLPSQTDTTTNNLLGNTRFALSARERNEHVNNLKDCGIDALISLPKIVFVGDQSSGKSSLIEAITRVKIPRGRDTCTRCPMEVQLFQAKETEDWSCTVKLHFQDDFNIQGVPARTPGTFQFDSTTDRNEVELLIARAQLAILNPTTPYERFRTLTKEDIESHVENELTFSKNSVTLKIIGDVVDLTFVDLPGVIQNTDMVLTYLFT
jgi:hypothetical protein